MKGKHWLSVGIILWSGYGWAQEAYQPPREYDWRAKVTGGIGDWYDSGFDRSAVLGVSMQRVLDKQVSIEAGYTFYPEFEHETQDAAIEIGLLQAAIVGYSPYRNKHRYFFRIGIYSAETELKESTERSSSSGLWGGAGIAWKLVERVGIIGEYNLTFGVEDHDIGAYVLGVEVDLF